MKQKKRDYLIFYAILVVLIIAFIGYGDKIVGMAGITGMAGTSGTTSASITINAAPVVSSVTAIAAQTITEGGMQQINITFRVNDSDGLGEINNLSAKLRINLSGQDVRTNYSCLANASMPDGAGGEDIITFNCSINIWFWDASGNWTINASIEDNSGAYGENSSTYFEIYQTPSMAMGPTALTWSSVELGAQNQTSNIDPIIINNTGNKNITPGSITITGYDLQGTSTSTDFIDAGNFSIHTYNGTAACTDENCFECNGTILINQTAVALQTANISIGNNTISTTCAEDETSNPTCTQEELFVCLHTVPTGISRETYNTAGAETASWVIAIS